MQQLLMIESTELLDVSARYLHSPSPAPLGAPALYQRRYATSRIADSYESNILCTPRPGSIARLDSDDLYSLSPQGQRAFDQRLYAAATYDSPTALYITPDMTKLRNKKETRGSKGSAVAALKARRALDSSSTRATSPPAPTPCQKNQAAKKIQKVQKNRETIVLPQTFGDQLPPSRQQDRSSRPAAVKSGRMGRKRKSDETVESQPVRRPKKARRSRASIKEPDDPTLSDEVPLVAGASIDNVSPLQDGLAPSLNGATRSHGTPGRKKTRQEPSQQARPQLAQGSKGAVSSPPQADQAAQGTSLIVVLKPTQPENVDATCASPETQSERPLETFEEFERSVLNAEPSYSPRVPDELNDEPAASGKSLPFTQGLFSVQREAPAPLKKPRSSLQQPLGRSRENAIILSDAVCSSPWSHASSLSTTILQQNNLPTASDDQALKAEPVSSGYCDLCQVSPGTPSPVDEGPASQAMPFNAKRRLSTNTRTNIAEAIQPGVNAIVAPSEAILVPRSSDVDENDKSHMAWSVGLRESAAGSRHRRTYGRSSPYPKVSGVAQALAAFRSAPLERPVTGTIRRIPGTFAKCSPLVEKQDIRRTTPAKCAEPVDDYSNTGKVDSNRSDYACRYTPKQQPTILRTASQSAMPPPRSRQAPPSVQTARRSGKDKIPASYSTSQNVKQHHHPDALVKVVRSPGAETCSDRPSKRRKNSSVVRDQHEAVQRFHKEDAVAGIPWPGLLRSQAPARVEYGALSGSGKQISRSIVNADGSPFRDNDYCPRAYADLEALADLKSTPSSPLNRSACTPVLTPGPSVVDDDAQSESALTRDFGVQTSEMADQKVPPSSSPAAQEAAITSANSAPEIVTKYRAPTPPVLGRLRRMTTQASLNRPPSAVSPIRPLSVVQEASDSNTVQSLKGTKQPLTANSNTKAPASKHTLADIAAWRSTLQLHHVKLFDELVNMSHGMVDRLSVQEAAARKVVEDLRSSSDRIMSGIF